MGLALKYCLWICWEKCQFSFKGLLSMIDAAYKTNERRIGMMIIPGKCKKKGKRIVNKTMKRKTPHNHKSLQKGSIKKIWALLPHIFFELLHFRRKMISRLKCRKVVCDIHVGIEKQNILTFSIKVVWKQSSLKSLFGAEEKSIILRPNIIGNHAKEPKNFFGN